MNLKSIERNGNKATIVVEIDKELMEKGINAAYLKARKQIAIPGFRKGKAPRKMIEAMYGAHVFYEDGLEEIFPEVYQFAVIEQDVKAIGRPSLEDMQISEENIVTLTLSTEVYPEVTLGQYKGLEVEKAEVSVSDEQVQAELDRMAQNVASTETVERAAEMGDTANIDFEGFDNGVPFDGGKGENFDLKLGSGQFVPGFEEQIVGMTAGEEKDIDITFPEDYHAELAGKAVVFHVKLNKVTVTNVPALDDEFAKDVSEFETLEELKADIRAKALENAEKQAASAFENAAVEKAAENTTVEMPAALIESELDNQMERFAYQLQMSGYSMDAYAKMMGGDVNTMRNAFRPAAEKQAKANVTLAKIVEVEGITVTDEDIEAEFEALTFGAGYDHNWAIDREDNGEILKVADVYSPKSGRGMEVYTDQIAIQFYSGNFFDGSYDGKYGKPLSFRESVVFETQKYPDAVNHDNFPSVVLNPGEEYTHTCIYKFILS